MTVVNLTIGCLLLVLAASAPADAQWPLGRDVPQLQKASESSLSVMSSGRFQVFVSPNVKGHTFMLDTDTGKVWIMKKDDTLGDFSFKRVPVEQIDDDQSGKPAAKQKTEEKQPAR